MIRRALAFLLAFFVATELFADPVGGKMELLCAPAYVMHCSSGGKCELGPAENYNIPSFLRIDLDDRVILTSAASDEQQRTPIQQMSRENGEIYLQGVENGRIFAIVINEASGDLALGIISTGETATAFGACTPD
jgi:hypothetical protein